KNTFLPTGFKERIELTVSAANATAETVTELAAGGGARRKTVTLTTTGSSPMTAAETCPNPSAPGAVPYISGVLGGVQTLAMILPYGKGEAVYTYRKQP